MIKYEVLTLSFKMGPQEVHVHPLLIHNGEEVILCDAGFPNQVEQIESELQKHGFSIQDLTKVVITHHDHDHIGSLSELKKMNSKLQVITSELEKDMINGRQKSLRLSQAENYNETLSGEAKVFGEQFVNYLKTIQKCEVDRIVSDRDYIIQGVSVVSTPGHTPGHIAIWIEKEDILFAGDAIAYENEAFVIANPEFTLDIERCKESIIKINNFAPKKIICYHGGVVENQLKEQLKNLIEQL